MYDGVNCKLYRSLNVTELSSLERLFSAVVTFGLDMGL